KTLTMRHLCVDRAALVYCIFSYTDLAATQIYTLSLHDALPISMGRLPQGCGICREAARSPSPLRALLRQFSVPTRVSPLLTANRSEEHTSELQSLRHLVCRLLLEKKKTLHKIHTTNISTQPYIK